MKVTISNKNIAATINSKGAELSSLKKNDKEYMWEGNPAFWGKYSPILFPIVGTLKNNSYRYNDKEFQLSRHGFARDNEFEIIESSNSEVVFSLKSNSETLTVYPFLFELRITYTIEGQDLIIKYDVLNHGDTEMPFSIGGHPAFALHNNFENYSLRFEKQESLKSYALESDLISNNTAHFDLLEKKLPLNYSLFENDALIFKTIESNYIDIIESENPLLRITFSDFPNLGIWTKQDAPFICIEPWFGYSDSLKSNGNILDKEGIMIIGKNQNHSSKFEIKIF